jgi:hypothetical protein
VFFRIPTKRELLTEVTLTNEGQFALLGHGDMATLGALTNSGAVDVEYGSTLQINGDVTNSGGLETDANDYGGGNKVNITGNLTNSGEFGLAGPGDKATIGGNATNNGQFFLFGAGSTPTVGGNVTDNGAVNLEGSTLTVGDDVGVNGASGLLTVNNGGTVTAQVLTIGALGEVDAEGGTLNYAALNDYGKLDPVGVANLIGNFLTVFPQGSIVLDLIGKSPGQYGQLDITGSALLSGLTVLDFMNGFAPKKGDIFDLINISGGTFDYSNNTIDIWGCSRASSIHLISPTANSR